MPGWGVLSAIERRGDGVLNFFYAKRTFTSGTVSRRDFLLGFPVTEGELLSEGPFGDITAGIVLKSLQAAFLPAESTSTSALSSGFQISRPFSLMTEEWVLPKTFTVSPRSEMDLALG